MAARVADGGAAGHVCFILAVPFFSNCPSAAGITAAQARRSVAWHHTVVGAARLSFTAAERYEDKTPRLPAGPVRWHADMRRAWAQDCGKHLFAPCHPILCYQSGVAANAARGFLPSDEISIFFSGHFISAAITLWWDGCLLWRRLHKRQNMTPVSRRTLRFLLPPSQTLPDGWCYRCACHARFFPYLLLVVVPFSVHSTTTVILCTGWERGERTSRLHHLLDCRDLGSKTWLPPLYGVLDATARNRV